MHRLFEFKNASRSLIAVGIGLGLSVLPLKAQQRNQEGKQDKLKTPSIADSIAVKNDFLVNKYTAYFDAERRMDKKIEVDEALSMRAAYMDRHLVQTGICKPWSNFGVGWTGLVDNQKGHNLWLTGSDEYRDGYYEYGDDLQHISFIQQENLYQASTIKLVPCTSRRLNIEYYDVDEGDIITSTPAVYMVPDQSFEVKVTIPFVPSNTRIVTGFELGQGTTYDDQKSELSLFDTNGAKRAVFYLKDRDGNDFDLWGEGMNLDDLFENNVIVDPNTIASFAEDFEKAKKLREENKQAYAVSDKNVNQYGRAFFYKEVRVFSPDMRNIDLYLLAEHEKNILMMPKSYEVDSNVKTRDMRNCQMRTYLGTDIYDDMKQNKPLKGDYQSDHEFYVTTSSDNGRVITGDYLRSGKFTFVVVDPRVADIVPIGYGNMALADKDVKHMGTVIETEFRSIIRGKTKNGEDIWIGVDETGQRYPINFLDVNGHHFQPKRTFNHVDLNHHNYIGEATVGDALNILKTEGKLLSGETLQQYERHGEPRLNLTTLKFE